MNHLQDLVIELEKYGIEKTIEPNQFFIKEGQIPHKIAFVKSGLFRYYYLTQDGKEFTKAFITENNFISSYTAMISTIPSFFNIQSLEKSTIIEIHFSKWNELLTNDAKWKDLLVFFLEKGYSAKEKRERDLLLLDAETRYLNFIKEYPNLDKRVNLTLIASFLGIQLESLSRIRKKLSI